MSRCINGQRNSKIRLHFNNKENEIDVSVNPNIFSIDNYTDIIYNVESLSVPKTYYNVIEQNSIKFTNSVNVDFDIFLIPGNYTLNLYLDNIVSQMTTNDPFVIYDWSQNLLTNIITIFAGGPSQYELIFSKPLSAKYIGAKLNKIYNSINDNIVFDYVPNMERTNNFIITTNLRNLNCVSYDSIKSINNLENKNNILCVIPCVFQPSDVSDIVYHRGFYGNYGNFNQTAPNFTTPIKMELKDDYLNLIDLNGSDWTIDLFLECNF